MAILSAYDKLIENNQRRIALLEKMAEEIYREWFVRLRFPGHEKVKKVKGVPEGWEIQKIGQLLIHPSSVAKP
ncbi:MAG: restriction endonuclease subunit S [Nitrosomonas sp.]|nr:restriction endonuclease subunit S [Nitrosomonas sp.]